MNQDNMTLFRGLKAVDGSLFPKRCAMCGRVYASVSDFVRETESIRNLSGLRSTLDDDDQTIVALFRNCECGSTLLGEFSDRRAAGEAGSKHRKLYGNLLALLKQKGIAEDPARAELSRFINGQSGTLLEKMGVQFRP